MRKKCLGTSKLQYGTDLLMTSLLFIVVLSRVLGTSLICSIVMTPSLSLPVRGHALGLSVAMVMR